MNRRKRIPKGPYPESRIGRCCCVHDANGLLLRAMPNKPAAENWRAKHFSGDPESVSLHTFSTAASVRREFDAQMKLGLTSEREIADLLWYGGVSSDWKGPKRTLGGEAV